MDGPLPQCSESDQHEDFDFQVMTGTKTGKLLVHEQLIINFLKVIYCML